MDTFTNIMTFILSIVAIAVVLYLSYKFSKYLASKVNVANNSNNMQVLERATLGQDKCLAIVDICGKFYVVGISNNNIDVLLELDDYEPSEETNNPQKFLDVLKETVKFKPGPKAGEDHEHRKN